MRTFWTRLKRSWRLQFGVNLAEYALILGVLALAGMGGLVAMGGNVSTLINRGSGDMAGAQVGGDSGGSSYYDNFDDHGNLNWKYYKKWHKCEGGICRSGSYRDWAVAGEKSWRDYEYTARLKTDRAGKHNWNVPRLVFRFQDPDNYYYLVPNKDGRLELAKHEHGKWKTWLASAPDYGDPTAWHTYKIRVVGNTITVFADGKKMLQYVDPHPIPAGQVGAYMAGARGRYGDVHVEPITPSRPAE